MRGIWGWSRDLPLGSSLECWDPPGKPLELNGNHRVASGLLGKQERNPEIWVVGRNWELGIPKYSNIPKFQYSKYSNVSKFQYSNTPIFQYFKIPTFKYFNIQTRQYSNILIFQYFKIPTFKYSNIQMFKYSNIPILQ